MVPAIFNPANLINVTLTGCPPHGQGAERASREYSCLNRRGKEAIIAFVESECIKRNWKMPASKEVNRHLTQVIGELKRDWKNKS